MIGCSVSGLRMRVQSDLSAALTAYIGSIPVAITYTSANAAAGVAFNTSVQFPPNNQLSAQASRAPPTLSKPAVATLLSLHHSVQAWSASL